MKRLLPLFLLTVAVGPLLAAVKLASPFTDHMVLQRDLPVAVWGTAEAGEKVTVSFAGQKKSAKADGTGQWRVELKQLKASAQSRTLIVTGSATPAPLQLTDVLVGEVWLASGQSNMDFTVAKTAKYYFAGVLNEAVEVAAANYPLVRMFTGEWVRSSEPRTEVPGTWKVCTPENVREFSAIAYFFARDLHQALNVPVGIVTLTYGASCAQAWIRRDAMLGDPSFKAVLDDFDAKVKAFVPLTDEENRQWEEAAAKARAEGKRAPRKPRIDPAQDQHNPTVMFNGMIAPFVGYALRGVLWYQGESITAPKELFPRWNELLITDWRKLWGREPGVSGVKPLPFYFCQLAALDSKGDIPQVRAWQTEALRLPATGMAVTIDVGDKTDVHPHNKAPVGNRLARIALAQTYGRALEYSGPVCSGIAVRDGTARLSFTHRGGGLVAKDGPLATFEVAGRDAKFVPAEAAIEGDEVVVRNAAVSVPVSVRYAWANYPVTCNFFNAAGLPAAPFLIAVPP